MVTMMIVVEVVAVGRSFPPPSRLWWAESNVSRIAA